MSQFRYYSACIVKKLAHLYFNHMALILILTQKNLPIFFIKTFILLCVSILTVACTPSFDWRTTRSSNHGDQYVITFPGKSLSAEKSVNLAGQPLPLMLSAVQVDSAQFALGIVPVSNTNQAQAIAAALADAFAANLKLNPAQTKTTAVLLKKSTGGFDVVYPVIGERYAKARFIWTEHAVYELLVIGKTEDLTEEIADTFIRSMQFE
jgi:hypothetical protein